MSGSRHEREDREAEAIPLGTETYEQRLDRLASEPIILGPERFVNGKSVGRIVTVYTGTYTCRLCGKKFFVFRGSREFCPDTCDHEVIGKRLEMMAIADAKVREDKVLGVVMGEPSDVVTSPNGTSHEGHWQASLPFINAGVSIIVSPEELDKGHAEISTIRGEQRVVYFRTSFREFSLVINGQELRVKLVQQPHEQVNKATIPQPIVNVDDVVTPAESDRPEA